MSDTDETWSQLHADIKTSQKPDHLNIYKALVRARRDLSIMYGDLEMRVLSDSVFAFTRYEQSSVLLIANAQRIVYHGVIIIPSKKNSSICHVNITDCWMVIIVIFD